MTALESEVTISKCVGQETHGGVAPDDSLANSESQQQKRKWQAVVDKLLGWWTNPEAVGYEELEPLSVALLEAAIGFAHDAQSAGELPPTACGPSVDGGISFEWRPGDGSLIHLEVTAIGLAEVTMVRSGKVLAHYWIQRDPEHGGWLKRDRPAA